MKDYTANEAQELLSAGLAEIIDVRTAGEIAACPLEGAIALPIDLSSEDVASFAARLQAARSDGKIAILMCHSGGRSKYLQTELAAMGISVGNLQGGIIAAVN